MYIRPTYGEVRLMTAEQKKIHMKNMQKLRDEKDFIKYGINYKHQKDYQKKEVQREWWFETRLASPSNRP